MKYISLFSRNSLVITDKVHPLYTHVIIRNEKEKILNLPHTCHSPLPNSTHKKTMYIKQNSFN
jgi:hypothetical protein